MDARWWSAGTNKPDFESIQGLLQDYGMNPYLYLLGYIGQYVTKMVQQVRSALARQLGRARGTRAGSDKSSESTPNARVAMAGLQATHTSHRDSPLWHEGPVCEARHNLANHAISGECVGTMRR
ncbi:protein of unknown function [Cupriavidus taiwanensis]|nr:protein of unknown function [Cupriavidus taiwanensis]